MVDIRANFTGSMPEFYDSCLGPAWFELFAADLAERLPPKPPGDRARDRLRNGHRDTATTRAARPGDPAGRQRPQQADARLRTRQAGRRRSNRMARGRRGPPPLRRRRVRRGGVRLRHHVRARQGDGVPRGAPRTQAGRDPALQRLGPDRGEPARPGDRGSHRGPLPRRRGNALPLALRDVRPRFAEGPARRGGLQGDPHRHDARPVRPGERAQDRHRTHPRLAAVGPHRETRRRGGSRGRARNGRDREGRRIETRTGGSAQAVVVEASGRLTTRTRSPRLRASRPSRR